LLYHLLVLLQASNVSLADVCTELARREGISGIEEKNSRAD
jgi:phosphoribosyl-ATP pyrophosphohydrolase